MRMGGKGWEEVLDGKQVQGFKRFRQECPLNPILFNTVNSGYRGRVGKE